MAIYYRLALSLYGQLNEMILSKHPYITYCDKSAVVQPTQQLSASKTRTRHLSMSFMATSSSDSSQTRQRVNAVCPDRSPES